MQDSEELRRLELIGGLLLLGAALLAMVLANSPWEALYDNLLGVRFEVRLGEASLDKPILLWINDGLMAIFFLLIGLEIKRDLLEGPRDPRRLVLPLGAALGGIAVPVAIYALFTGGDAQQMQGWAIPAATDIAFALGMLALLGARVLPSLRHFLLTLAVFDDIAAIVIIAVFYTERISWTAKGLALGALAVLVLLNLLRVTRYGVYLLVGVFLWLCVLKSGVHATLAGVALGLTIPWRPKNALGHRPLHQLELVLRPWVMFVVLPAFAFVNAGVALRGLGLETLAHPVALGVAGGLVVGKTVGVFGATWLLLRTGLAERPDGVSDLQLLGVSALAGIGFTMSLLIGVLAFEDAPRTFGAAIRLGVLGGSALAAVLGLLVLHRSLPRVQN